MGSQGENVFCYKEQIQVNRFNKHILFHFLISVQLPTETEAGKNVLMY